MRHSRRSSLPNGQSIISRQLEWKGYAGNVIEYAIFQGTVCYLHTLARRLEHHPTKQGDEELCLEDRSKIVLQVGAAVVMRPLFSLFGAKLSNTTAIGSRVATSSLTVTLSWCASPRAQAWTHVRRRGEHTNPRSGCAPRLCASRAFHCNNTLLLEILTSCCVHFGSVLFACDVVFLSTSGILRLINFVSLLPRLRAPQQVAIGFKNNTNHGSSY